MPKFKESILIETMKAARTLERSVRDAKTPFADILNSLSDTIVHNYARALLREKRLQLLVNGYKARLKEEREDNKRAWKGGP